MSATVSGDAQLASRLSLAVGRLHRRVRIATNDVPPLQLSTLVSIENHGPLRLGELAQREAVTAPTMSRVLVALGHRGLIVRTIDAEDARSVRVALSPEGSACSPRCVRDARRCSTRGSPGSAPSSARRSPPRCPSWRPWSPRSVEPAPGRDDPRTGERPGDHGRSSSRSVTISSTTLWGCSRPTAWRLGPPRRTDTR